ncbi:OrNVorf54-like [Venturia canescens]|uniref:OrNVorf54-like n=2 Tax=Venturia canescens TaxID=32260 RepID=A0ACB9ZKN6_9HYME|nr:uncharacterized LOC122408203 [Venturia canescens]AJZ73121.1 hypothetical protein [Venturia canescens]KAI5630587.1 OrNVorf54-like [Venturia canescens]
MTDSIKTFETAEEYFSYIKKHDTSKSKLDIPTNLHTIIASFDQCKSPKKQFAGISVLLGLMYKRKIRQQRKDNLNDVRSNHTQIKAPKLPLKQDSNLCRSAFVPDEFKQCSSPFVKGAIAMFCLQSSKESIRRDLLFAILQGAIVQNDDILNLARESFHSIRETISENYAVNDETKKQIICGMLVTSDVLREKSYSKLAMTVDPKIYILVIKHFTERSQFNTIFPYTALITKYISTSIASKFQASERDKILNVFNVNAKSIVRIMIESLPNDRQMKSVKFDENMKYFVFRGPTNFPKDIVYSYINFNGKIYQVATYKDCLYDVFGNEDELFNKHTWHQRLDSIDYRTKIIIEEMSGAELNNLSENATVAISWMEDGMFRYKTHTFVRREIKKNGK